MTWLTAPVLHQQAHQVFISDGIGMVACVNCSACLLTVLARRWWQCLINPIPVDLNW
jgi:hypothetical protein